MAYEQHVKIVSSGKYIPERIIDNAYFEGIIDTTDEWIYSRTGIKHRHFAEDYETVVDLASNAAWNCLNKRDYDPHDIDLIIVATCTSEMRTPSVANMVQGRLGLNDKEVMCFDVNAACTGAIYGLQLASSLLQTHDFNAALIIGAEKLSSVINYEDRGTCVLFGDGAGAILLEKTKESKPAYFYTSSKADVEHSLEIRDNKLSMDGKKVYQFATNAMEKSIRRIMELAHTTLEFIDKIIPHQANIRIIETASRFLNVEPEKFFMNIEEYGNTSAASVMIAFDEYYSSMDFTSGKQIVFVGFGGGFTWGAALFTL